MKARLRVEALVLAVLMAVSLFAGCNKNRDKDISTTPTYIYNAEYTKLEIDAEDYYVSYTAVSSDAVYLIVNLKEGEEEVFYTDLDENGNEIQSSYMQSKYVSRLFKAGLDGKNIEMLPNFELDESYKSTDKEDRNNYISQFFTTNDGTPGVIRSEIVTVYDVPENFDPKNDQKWNYNSNSTQTYYYETFDQTGKVIDSKVIAKVANGDGMGADYFAIDSEGNNYVAGWNGITVYNSDFSKTLYTPKAAEVNVNGVVRLADGRVAVGIWGEKSMQYFIIDLSKGELGKIIPVPANAYIVLPGSAEYVMYNRTEAGITGIKADGAFEETVNWIDSDIDSELINSVNPLENGDFICTCDVYDDEGKHTTELVHLARAPYSPDTERQVLNMACMGINYLVKSQVVEFNKKNTKYKIRMTDYSQYNTGDDSTAGVTKLNTEIIAGHIPDIFYIGGSMPITQYAGRGVLEDLTPYMEKDFGKDAFVEDFFKTLRNDEGKLYEAYASFTISTAVGLEEVVGDGSSWTFNDMKAAMEKLRDGATVLNDYYNRENAVQNFLYNGTSRFVDWETGKCTFDSAEFVDLLNFVKSFKTQEEIDALSGGGYSGYEEEYTRLNSGKQLLMEVSISDFDYFRASTFYTLDGTPSFVGYPGAGSEFSAAWGVCYAISSKSEYKDAAWSFVKEILTEDYQNGNLYNGLPTNKAVFEKLLAESKTPEYIAPSEETVDGDYGIAYGGDYGKISTGAEEEPAESVDDITRYSDFNKGSVNEQGWKEIAKTFKWCYDSKTGKEWQIPVFAMTDAEEQDLRALMSGITAFARTDISLRDIIDEETQAFFSGQKSAEETAKMIQSRATIYVNEQK